MPIIEKTIKINVPANVVYDQWTQFEDFPKLMEGVIDVTQLNDTHLRWVAEIIGRNEEWETEIPEQIPDSLSPQPQENQGDRRLIPGRALPGCLF